MNFRRWAGAIAATMAAVWMAAPALAQQCGGLTSQPCAYFGLYAGEPRYGSPNSMQLQASASSLDMFDVQPEGEDAFTPEGDSDTVGGAFTYYKAGAQKGERYDLHYQHARRIGEGTRARFLLDVPININHVDKESIPFTYVYNGMPNTIDLKIGGATSVYATVNAGIEFPVKPNWLVTPRLAYSNSQAGDYFNHDAELASASLTSRYKIPQVGRGDLVIGNAVTYSRTIDTPLAKQPFFEKDDLWTLRNGIAYQLPLKRRFMGRQTSLRASYVFTYMTSPQFQLAFQQIHELGVSIGIRTREAEQKNRFEQMRIGLLYTHGKNEFTSKASYDSVTLTLGYRF